VELSMNGQQFTSSGVSFTYQPAPAVSSVWPTGGAAEGGTPVTVLGSGFSSSAEAMGALLCRFDASVVPAAYVSESAVICNSTRSSRGYVTVEVSTNGREYTSDGVQFELVSVVVSGIAPWSGPELGGTVVTIAGSGLASGGDLVCRFGGASIGVGGLPVPVSAVPASAHGTDGVRCVSPSALPVGWTSVELSSFGVTLQSGGSFYVHGRMIVSALVPPAGPVRGGTRVAVLGSGFRESATQTTPQEQAGT
jgi:hypothetical protein